MKKVMIVFVLLTLLFCLTGYAQSTYQEILCWGSQGSENGQFMNPYGVAVDSAGFVYVADVENHRIQKFDSNGGFVLKWGDFGSGDGQFNHPLDVALDSAGNLYVADQDNYRIQKFTSDGQFLAKWGNYGGGDGQFVVGRGLCIDSADNVYVLDCNLARVQKFDSSGNFITKWGYGGYEAEDGQFYYPYGMDVSSDGFVYVADTFNHRIQKFDANGNFLAKWGSVGGGDGQFQYPTCVAVGSDGNVYVGDTYNARVQKFDANGNFITKWDSYYPHGAAIDSDGYVYIATWNCHVIKYALPNRSPVAIGHDIEKPAGAGCQADAAARDFDNGSYDPDGDSLVFSVSPAGPYPMGDTVVTLTVSDPDGATASCTAKITVHDATPPQIASLTASPDSLWPANHKMVPVSILVSAGDGCSAPVTSRIVNVTSNEPINGLGDGDTAPDWAVTGLLTLNLRAERSGTGSGRIYTITIECSDAAGNKTTGNVTVKVPLNRGK